MKVNCKVLVAGFLYFCLASCSVAQSQGIKVPVQETQRLSIDNLNFTAAGFIEAYMSKEVSQRRLAEMYLIGVLDSTEGKVWCGYDVALPGSIQEQVYIGFKKMDVGLADKRASDVIAAILSKKLPCKEGR